MNSQSEQRLSLEELKQRNALPPTKEPSHPTQEEWEEMLAILSALYRLEIEQRNVLEDLERRTAAHTALSAGAFQLEGVVPHPGEDGGTDGGCGPNAEDAATGWEKERAAFFSALHSPAQTTPASSGWADLGYAVDDFGGVGASLVGLGRRLEQTQSAAPVRDATTTPSHTDRKIWRRQQEKKIALGHKADDHEDKPTWEPSM